MDELRIIQQCPPAVMDALWAMGWRHFGIYFFRSRTEQFGDRLLHVMPLRIDLAKFTIGRGHRRTLNRNADLTITYEPAAVDAERQALFHRHKTRFHANVPDSLHDFLSPRPDRVPCEGKTCSAWLDGRLLATSYFDVGERALSAVYAMFEPAEHRRSLGILMILKEIEFARRHGFRYLYTGYAHVEPSHYEYKKQFRGTERLDWETGRFLPLHGEA